METLEFTLTKKRNYSLTPFGRFIIKWAPSKTLKTKEHIIPIAELTIFHDTSMPCSVETDDNIVKFMKKHKTDILIDSDNRFFTRIGIGFSRVEHSKLLSFLKYKESRVFENNETEFEKWDMYVKKR